MIKNTTTTTPVIANTNLSETILTFFKEHNKSWCNSKSISDKCEALKNISIINIRANLDAMVTAKKLRSRKSEKGNWSLYRI